MEAVVFCPSCGKPLSAEFSFCPYCGNSTRDELSMEEALEEPFREMGRMVHEQALVRLQELETRLSTLDEELTAFLSLARRAEPSIP